jgi:predicted nucleic acid-binding Zn ribbon protein
MNRTGLDNEAIVLICFLIFAAFIVFMIIGLPIIGSIIESKKKESGAFCKACGKQIPSDSYFCPKCGQQKPFG